MTNVYKNKNTQTCEILHICSDMATKLNSTHVRYVFVLLLMG